jgi:hypothetical protein
MRDAAVVTVGRRSRWVAVGAVVAFTFGSGGLLGASASTASGERDVFVPIAPCRLFDTRPAPDNVGTRIGPLGPGEAFTAVVRGTNGNCTIPADALGVSMNVTIIQPSAASFLSVYPSDVGRPSTANLNWVPGQAPTPNAVVTRLSADGRVAFYNLAGSVHVAADVNGYYVDHNHDDRYYTKTQIDTKLPSTGSVLIGAPAFVGRRYDVGVDDDGLDCKFVSGSHGASNSAFDELDAGVELPAGVTITGITAMIGNVHITDFVTGDFGGTVTLYRRTLGSFTPLAQVTTIGLVAGPHIVSATLATPEPVTAGRYYTLRFHPDAAGFPLDPVICGAQISYTNPS